MKKAEEKDAGELGGSPPPGKIREHPAQLILNFNLIEIARRGKAGRESFEMRGGQRLEGTITPSPPFSEICIPEMRVEQGLDVVQIAQCFACGEHPQKRFLNQVLREGVIILREVQSPPQQPMVLGGTRALKRGLRAMTQLLGDSHRASLNIRGKPLSSFADLLTLHDVLFQA
jgi:hypothetical protein